MISAPVYITLFDSIGERKAVKVGDDNEDIDIDRVIADPGYRRMVIRRLNRQARAAEPVPQKPPAAGGGPPSASRRRNTGKGARKGEG